MPLRFGRRGIFYGGLAAPRLVRVQALGQVNDALQRMQLEYTQLLMFRAYP